MNSIKFFKALIATCRNDFYQWQRLLVVISFIHSLLRKCLPITQIWICSFNILSKVFLSKNGIPWKQQPFSLATPSHKCFSPRQPSCFSVRHKCPKSVNFKKAPEFQKGTSASQFIKILYCLFVVLLRKCDCLNMCCPCLNSGWGARAVLPSSPLSRQCNTCKDQHSGKGNDILFWHQRECWEVHKVCKPQFEKQWFRVILSC